jgi:hypothetical protein
MGFFKSLGKILHVVDDPVSSALRKQGGTLGTIGSIMNPGGAVNAKIAAGAPVNARTMLDPNGWIVPTPPPPEAPPVPLPPMPTSPAGLPMGLQSRPVPYSTPTTNGALTQLAYQMAGPPGGPGAPMPPMAPPVNQQPNPARDVGLFPMPNRVNAQGLPMLDPLTIARLGMYQNGQ